jgi:protein-disulfide isomerase
MRLNPTTIAAAAVSSLVTLCATILVITIAPNGSREQGLTNAQRAEIAVLVKDRMSESGDRVNKTAPEQSLSNSQRAEVIRIVREHFRSNPEAMQEILAEIIKKRTPAAAAQAPANADKSALIKSNEAALFASVHQVNIGNPQGDVTLVEFFDYNCGFCKRALPDTFNLMKADPKLKIVLKELPILGPGSLEAAKVAIAVRMQDPSGAKYLEFHQKLLTNNGPANKANALAVAQAAGLDVARLEKDMDGEEVIATLDESRKLAHALGINGTPSYVVGNKLVIGAVGLAALSDTIKSVRN